MDHQRISYGVILLLGGILCWMAVFQPARSQSQDTAPRQTHKEARDGPVIEKGIVKDGDKIPIPGGYTRDEVTIWLSLREINDHAQVSARIECYVKEDGTARVRSVRRAPDESPTRYKNKLEDSDVLDRGTAAYLVLVRSR